MLDVALVLLLAAIVGTLALLARQPLILAFLAVGILVGPSAFGFIQDGATIHFLGQLGVTMLLFLVGMRLDPRELRRLGLMAGLIGSAQAVATAALGFGLALLLGFDLLTALYVGVALTFSSTIIIVKLLSDRRELDTLHGRIAVGVLIVQDLLVIAVFTVLSFSGTGTDFSWTSVLSLILRAVLLIAGAWLAVRLARLWLLDQLAHSKEFLGTAAIAWAVALAAAAEWAGLSMELGAFVAGVTFATTAYRDAIGSRLTALRDFLVLFFLVDLGGFLDWGVLGDQLVPALILSAFVLLGKPLILLTIMGAAGYRRRTSFLTGLSMAQISEFSLIMVALGLGLGHITTEAVGLVTLVALITIAASTYLILFGPRLAVWMEPSLRWFERVTPWREVDEEPETPGFDVILFGLGRFGQELHHALVDRDQTVLAFDQDPAMLRQARSHGIDAKYGDAHDPEFAAVLPLADTQWVVSTVPDAEVNRSLVAALRHFDFRGRIALTAHTADGVKLLDAASPDRVLLPFHDAAETAADQLFATRDV